MNYLAPKDIAPVFRDSAGTKAGYSNQKLFFYSILGGAFIAVGGLLSLVVAGGMPGIAATNPGLVKFALGAVFPVGLIMVIVAGAELFTSDCAVLPMGGLAKKTTWSDLVRVWTIVYVGNFVGAFLVAWILAYQTDLLAAAPWSDYLEHIVHKKTSASFLKTFVKGVGANWLVCLAVWMSYGAKDVVGKSLALWLPVMAFVTMGYEHSIANMFFIPTGILYGADLTWGGFIVKNLIPATLGNIVGGALFVGVAYWYMFLKNDSKDQKSDAHKPDDVADNNKLTEKQLVEF